MAAVRRAAGAALLVTLSAVLALGDAPGQEPTPAPPAEAAKGPPADEPPAAFPVPELHDEAFDRFVDPLALARAVADRDAPRLADAALLTAEAERILGRPHRVVPADRLLGVAVRVAADRGDKDTLARLAARAAALGKDDLAAKARAGAALSTATRATTFPPELGFDKLSDETRADVQQFLTDVRAARALGDAAAFPGLERGLGTLPDLTPEQRGWLGDQLADAGKNLPAGDDATQALARLAGVSRAMSTGLPPVNARIVAFAAGYLNKGKDAGRVGKRGECSDLADLALLNAGGRPGTIPASENYVWGNVLQTLAETKPGDILQMRDLKIETTTRTGSGTRTSTISAPHHTAVVERVSNGGTYLNVYEQNTGNGTVKYVTPGVYDLRGLKAGHVWVYRPAPATITSYVVVANHSRGSFNFTLGGGWKALAPGAQQRFSTSTSTGAIRGNVNVSTATTDSAYSVPLEGGRNYEMTAAGLRKGEWAQ